MDVHTDAILARLDEHPHLTLFVPGAPPANTILVYDGPRDPSDPNQPVRQPPYVLVYVYVPNDEKTKLNQRSTDRLWISIETHAAGASRVAADGVRSYVRTQLVDWVPTVAGWQCQSIVHDRGDAAAVDTTTGIALMDAVDYWDYRAQPTA